MILPSSRGLFYKFPSTSSFLSHFSLNRYNLLIQSLLQTFQTSHITFQLIIKNVSNRRSSLSHIHLLDLSSTPILNHPLFSSKIIRSLTSLIVSDHRKEPKGKSSAYPSLWQTQSSRIIQSRRIHHQQDHLYTNPSLYSQVLVYLSPSMIRARSASLAIGQFLFPQCSSTRPSIPSILVNFNPFPQPFHSTLFSPSFSDASL